MATKRIPYGISDFRRIAEENYYYVDKTRFIEEVEMANIPEMAVGGHALRDVHAAVIDLDYVNSLYDKHLRRRVAGLLGCDFLVRYGAIIDYENRRLTLKVSDEISHY